MKEITNPFRSFWMGGYECTDQLNTHGDRVDFLHVTDHLAQIESDYARLGPFGIATVREGLRWSQVERVPYQYDFSTLRQMLAVGRSSGIQQVWDICHFGYPDDLTPLHPHFARRFAALCEAFALFYKQENPGETLIVTPINEVSFMAWLGGDVAGTSPYCRHNGWEVKYALMRAYIAGVQALRAVDPGVRILTTEPLVNVVPPFGATPDQIMEAANFHDLQYQAVDMLSGRMCPELGGRPEYLDLLGFNYYYNNQWEIGTHGRMVWNETVMDTRWRTLSALMEEVYRRYDRPVVLSETSHPGGDRPYWYDMIGHECRRAIEGGVPLWGVCLYPIIDRPNWDNLDDWHASGLWDADPLDRPKRRLDQPTAAALLAAQHTVEASARQSSAQQRYQPIQHFGGGQKIAKKSAIVKVGLRL